MNFHEIVCAYCTCVCHVPMDGGSNWDDTWFLTKGGINRSKDFCCTEHIVAWLKEKGSTHLKFLPIREIVHRGYMTYDPVGCFRCTTCKKSPYLSEDEIQAIREKDREEDRKWVDEPPSQAAIDPNDPNDALRVIRTPDELRIVATGGFGSSVDGGVVFCSVECTIQFFERILEEERQRKED